MRIGSLFSGVGGLDLGVEQAGLGRTIWQVEIDPFARSVLTKNFPRTDRYTDVRAVSGPRETGPRARLPPVDLLVGGFPCQGFSQAGKRLGFCDPRSGLWSEMLRIIGELRPKGLIIENVIELARSKGSDRVVQDLRDLGYDVAPLLLLNAATLGAPHRRKRVFFLAVDRSRQRSLVFEEPNKPRTFYPAIRGAPQHAWEPPRALPKATRYPGTFKRERLYALGNAVMPPMGFFAGMAFRDFVRTGNIDRWKRYAADVEVAPPLRFWPTPVTTDRTGSRRETARTEAYTSNPGTTLTDAVWLDGDYGKPLNPEWVEALMGFPRGYTHPG